MLRLLWKFVLEVIPPACGTVVAGVLLSAYNDHLLPLQHIIDPRTSLEQVATPAAEGGDQRQAAIAPRVESERSAGATQIDSKSPAPGPDANAPARAGDGNSAEAKTSESPETQVLGTKPAEASATDTQAAQFDAMLMASSPMAQPPAAMTATRAAEAKAPDGTPAEAQPAGDPAAATKATDVSPPAAEPAEPTSPDDRAVVPALRPHLSRHLARPAHKVTSFKTESERLPPPSVVMVPLPPPAAPPMVAMERPLQAPPNRPGLPPPPQALPTPPQAAANADVASAPGPTGPQTTLPGAPQLNASEEGSAKTPEPKRLFGVPIPRPIAAVGDALDPRPVLSAGQKVFEKIVVTAKSVVPDFGREQ
jgi:hypothetical protein